MLRQICLVRIGLALCALALVVFGTPSSRAADLKAATTAPVLVDQGETVIVFIGDSLTQGYGVRSEEAYPALVGRNLKRDGFNVKIVNGGISGSVTAEADARVRWYLKVKPKIIVLALGANDGMKGTPATVIENNLIKAIDLARENGITVLLSGLRMFSNLGPEYVSSFESIFPRLAKEKHLPLIPFLLEDVALQKELNQSDMRHPNAKGHELIATRVTAKLEAILRGRK
ncbi:arylesterase [soil metagenome]